MKIQALIPIARDVLSLAIGTGGIVYQQWTGKVNGLLLAVYAGMIGLPTGISLVMLQRGKSNDPDTPEQSSPSVPLS